MRLVTFLIVAMAVVLKANTVEAASLGKPLVELEAHVQWKAVDAAWRTKRSGWVNDCKTTTTDAEIAKLLLEFEQNVRWQAVDAGWKALRDGWIARLEG